MGHSGRRMRFRCLTATVATTGGWHFEWGDSASVKAKPVRRTVGYRLGNSHSQRVKGGFKAFPMVLVGQLAGEDSFKYWPRRVQIVEATRKKVEAMTSLACACQTQINKSCHVRVFYAQGRSCSLPLSEHHSIVFTGAISHSYSASWIFMQTRYSRERVGCSPYLSSFSSYSGGSFGRMISFIKNIVVFQALVSLADRVW
jgi:hypothetical protein